MAEIVRLELPEELVRHAREIGASSGRSVEDILTQWLERGSVVEDVLPLKPGVEYPIYTIFGMEKAAQALGEFLKAEEKKDTDPKDSQG